MIDNHAGSGWVGEAVTVETHDSKFVTGVVTAASKGCLWFGWIAVPVCRIESVNLLGKESNEREEEDGDRADRGSVVRDPGGDEAR